MRREPGHAATSRRHAAVVALVLANGVAPLRGQEDARAITYHEHVAPIFRERCIGCHGGEKPKSGLDLESLESAMRGGDEGPPLLPGKPDESLLFLLISGAERPLMPPRKQGKLEPAEIATIRAWIEGGCRPGEPPVEAAPYSRPLEPPQYARAPAVRALEYSADGALLFVAAFREVVVRDTTRRGQGLPAARLVGEADQINALDLSPDGGLLAAAGGNAARFGELQLWSVERRELVRFLRIGQDTLYAVAFSPDGRHIAVAGTDRAIHVIETETGNEVLVAENHSDWVFGVAWDVEGGRIASGSRDKTVKVSAVADGALIRSLGDLGGQVLRVASRPGSAEIVAAGESGVPVLFDLAKLAEVRKIESQPGEVLAVAFSPDGSLLAVGGSSREVRVYGAEDGERRARFELPERWVYALAIAGGNRFVTASGYDGVVHVFDLDSNKEAYSFVPVPVGRSQRF